MGRAARQRSAPLGSTDPEKKPAVCFRPRKQQHCDSKASIPIHVPSADPKPSGTLYLSNSNHCLTGNNASVLYSFSDIEKGNVGKLLKSELIDFIGSSASSDNENPGAHVNIR